MWDSAQIFDPAGDVVIDQIHDLEHLLVVTPQIEPMNRLMVGDPIAELVEPHHRPVNHSPVSRGEVRKRVSECLRPENRLVSLVEQKAPEPEVQLGNDTSSGLSLSPFAETLTCRGDLFVPVFVQDLSWVVVPRARSARSGVPSGQLFMEGIPDDDLKMAEHLEERAGHSCVPFVERHGAVKIATSCGTVRSEALDTEPLLEQKASTGRVWRLRHRGRYAVEERPGTIPGLGHIAGVSTFRSAYSSAPGYMPASAAPIVRATASSAAWTAWA